MADRFLCRSDVGETGAFVRTYLHLCMCVRLGPTDTALDEVRRTHVANAGFGDGVGGVGALLHRGSSRAPPHASLRTLTCGHSR